MVRFETVRTFNRNNLEEADMKIFCTTTLLLVWLSLGTVHGHILNLLFEDQEDGTLVVSGLFSTGQSAAGAMVQIKSLASGDILYANRLPAESELVVIIPGEPYTIILDGGPMHKVIAKGPPPPAGFAAPVTKSAHSADPNREKISASRILWTLSGLLWGLALFFGYKKIKIKT